MERNLKLSNIGFIKKYSSRQVNSLYFDSENYSSLEESISGSSIRRKTRLRWYGKIKEASSPTLECKYKQGVSSWKKLMKTNLHLNSDSKSWFDAFDSQNLSLSSILKDDHCAPVSLVSYRRQYYESFDGRVRVTLDHDLTYLDQTKSSRPNFEYYRQNPEKLVLEIKLAQEDLSLLDDFTYKIAFHPQRFSKYCESIVNHRSRWGS